MPSCCLTCRDCNIALSLAILASTRLPMPAVRVSDSLLTKVAWIENFAEPADNCARAESTLVSELWIVVIMDEAFACVETVPVDVKVTIVLDRLKFCAEVVTWRVPSDEAKASILVVEPSTR